MTGRRRGTCTNCGSKNVELCKGLCVSSCYHSSHRAKKRAEREARFPEAMEALLQKGIAEQLALLVQIQKCVAKLREELDTKDSANLATITTIVQSHMVPLVQKLDKSREILVVGDDDSDEDDEYHVYGDNPPQPPDGNPSGENLPEVFVRTDDGPSDANTGEVGGGVFVQTIEAPASANTPQSETEEFLASLDRLDSEPVKGSAPEMADEDDTKW